jgi:hypothetical protein
MNKLMTGGEEKKESESNFEVLNKQEKKGKALFDRPELGLAFISNYAQTQTTWAVLILAFLAGLLAELSLNDPINSVPTLLDQLAPILLYELLLFGLYYSIDRFLIATSVTKKAITLFGKKHVHPFPWQHSKLQDWMFKNDDDTIIESRKNRFFAVMFIIFEIVLLSRLSIPFLLLEMISTSKIP